MNILFLARLVTSVIPILLLIAPGIDIVSVKKENDSFNYFASVILWSLSIGILSTFVLSALHLSVFWYLVILATSVVVGIVNFVRLTSKTHKQIFIIFLSGLAIYLFFIIPFLYLQKGMPAGDSQKAIYWANQIMSSNSLPDYQSAIIELSRDPVDFFTPGLHSVTAFLIRISPLPLTVVGFFSIAVSVAVAAIAVAISRQLYGKQGWLLPLLTAFFIFSQYRFLRYLNQPGYHYQNIVGELLLFGALYLALLLMKQWRWDKSILLAAVFLSLAISHQFSAFIAVFMLAPIAVIFVLTKLEWKKKEVLALQLTAPLSALALVGTLVLSLGLYKKLPHFFTITPHLSDLLPSLLDYPKLMGLPWVIVGVAGLTTTFILAARSWIKKSTSLSFSLSIIVLTLLSQGPRIFIDIPPVRALLYLAVPLSITGAYFVYQLLQRSSARLLKICIVIVILMVGTASLARAYNFSHEVRTDSSLTPNIVLLNDYLLKQPENGGVLTDDYNKQSTSWLLLSGKPMFTRVSSDLSRQMSEAGQSRLRYQLYLDQLNFEKIFELGSMPEIVTIMDKHNIRWVTGVEKSSNSAFAHNPALSKAEEAEGITLYERHDNIPVTSNVITPWLLRASTLANDIGDDEDTFEHLSASVRASRLSDPQYDGRRTFRKTTAPLIPLVFNVNDYVRALWDKEMTGQAQTALELEVRFTQRPNLLRVQTSTGKTFQIVGHDATIRIPAEAAQIDEDGFVTLMIENSNQETVGIDFIALGLGRTP